MPVARKPENKGLPTRWRFTHGAYYYRVPPGNEGGWDGKKLFRLGARLPEAYKIWAERIGRRDKAIITNSQLLERYKLEVIPKKAPKTQIENTKYISKLDHAFGKMGIANTLPRHIYAYYERSPAKTLARRQLALLFHAYTKAVEWGELDRHPFRGQIRLPGEAPRDRYVEDWEIVECLSLKSKRKKGSLNAIGAYIRLKLLTGMSQSDMLRLQPARHFNDEGITIQRHKVLNTSGKKTTYLWTPELREAVRQAKQARPVHISPWLFCNKIGQSYINEVTGSASGWHSMWQRFMDRVLKETEVKERFTEHDLRAKAASDAASLEHARALLSHADSRITERVYRRKPEKVHPIR